MDPAVLREDMVDGVEHALGAVEPAVATAMRTVPRHAFVDDRPHDHRDGEQAGTRVLAPRTVARLFGALDLDGDETLLLVGTGVGYTAGIAAELVGARRVHAIDIARPLVREARRNLDDAGYGGVLVDRRDGSDGLPTYAPFDRVLVEAAAVRPPAALVDQLAPDGRLVMPLGAGGDQTLVTVERSADADATPARDEAPTTDGSGQVVAEHGSVTFAPLLVDGEQAGTGARNRTVREDRAFARQREQERASSGWEHGWIDWEGHDGGTRPRR